MNGQPARAPRWFDPFSIALLTSVVDRRHALDFHKNREQLPIGRRRSRPLGQVEPARTISLAELTQHIPPKGVHYIRRYGLYSSRTRSRWSRLPHVLRLSQKSAEAGGQDRTPPAQQVSPSRASSTWARLISKVYGEDPFVCPHCGHQMKVLAVITDPLEVDRILRHLVKIGRAPPGLDVNALQ